MKDRLVLDKLSAHSTKEYPATAFVQVELDGNKLSTSSIGGNGPVDAVYNAILNLTGLDIKMSHYNLTAKGEGAEALGQVDIVVEHEGRKFHGVGLATDIVESSALALVHAINAIYRAHKVADIKSHKHHINPLSKGVRDLAKQHQPLQEFYIVKISSLSLQKSEKINRTLV